MTPYIEIRSNFLIILITTSRSKVFLRLPVQGYWIRGCFMNRLHRIKHPAPIKNMEWQLNLFPSAATKCVDACITLSHTGLMHADSPWGNINIIIHHNFHSAWPLTSRPQGCMQVEHVWTGPWAWPEGKMNTPECMCVCVCVGHAYLCGVK